MTAGSPLFTMPSRALEAAVLAWSAIWLSSCAFKSTVSSSDFSDLTEHLQEKSPAIAAESSIDHRPTRLNPRRRQTHAGESLTAAAVMIVGLAVAVLVVRCTDKMKIFERPSNGLRWRSLAAGAAEACASSSGEARDLELGTLSAARRQLKLLELPSDEWERLEAAEQKAFSKAHRLLESLMEKYHRLRDRVQELESLMRHALTRYSPPVHQGDTKSTSRMNMIVQDDFREVSTLIESAREKLSEAMEHLRKLQWRQHQDRRSLLIMADYFEKGGERGDISLRSAKARMACTVILNRGEEIPEFFTEEEQLTVKKLVNHKIGQAANYIVIIKGASFLNLTRVFEAVDLSEDLSEMSTLLSACNMEPEAEQLEKAAARLKNLAEALYYSDEPKTATL